MGANRRQKHIMMAVSSTGSAISPTLLQAIQTASVLDTRIIVTTPDGQQYSVEASVGTPERRQRITVLTSDGERHVVVMSSSDDVVPNSGDAIAIADSSVVILREDEAPQEIDTSEDSVDVHNQETDVTFVQSRTLADRDATKTAAPDEKQKQLIIYTRNEDETVSWDANSMGATQNVRFQGPDGIYYLVGKDDGAYATKPTAATSPSGVVLVASDNQYLHQDLVQKENATCTTLCGGYTRPKMDTEPGTYVSQFTDKGPCPVCGDKISGYHYGVFSCESCKGFFKRSIQNGKTFSCVKGANCTVGLHNRRKCASCRFTKCLAVGMKLDAVRNDRSRGGRSVYEGCSPRLPKPKQTANAPVSHSPPVKKARLEHNSKLLCMLSQSQHSSKLPQMKASVPYIVTEIMNLESLLCDDDDEDIGIQKTDENLYTCLLQIADQRLYKIVRWARSLPHFAGISTDDQIALLQNAWAELLCLDCCWRSLQTPNEIKLSYTKSIDSNIAEQLNITDIYERVLQLRDHLVRVQMDMHEFACLKVLILMTPDMGGLHDHVRVREYQESVTEALSIYTITHYPKIPDKFGNLLLRLSEIAKLSTICREMLNRTDLPPEVSSFSLLMELLKTP